jgi:hypothetical protein
MSHYYVQINIAKSNLQICTASRRPLALIEIGWSLPSPLRQLASPVDKSHHYPKFNIANSNSPICTASRHHVIPPRDLTVLHDVLHHVTYDCVPTPSTPSHQSSADPLACRVTLLFPAKNQNFIYQHVRRQTNTPSHFLPQTL